MVDSISNNAPSNTADLLRTQQQEKVEQINRKAAESSEKVSSLNAFTDTAEVSTGAKRMLESEHFGRIAQTLPEPQTASSEKIARLREMVQSGRINDILGNVTSEQLADDLLKSPAGAFLR